MKHFISIAALSAALLAAPAFADDGATLTIENFIGTVNIVTEGASIDVNGASAGTVDRSRSITTIDGGETVDPSYCKSVNGSIDLSIGKKSWFKRIGGYKNIKDYPALDISVPEGTALEIRDSVIFGAGETFSSVDAHIKSCGSFEVGDIDGPLALKVSGSGDFDAANVGTANIRISGSGDVTLGDMQTAVLKVSGSGDLQGGNIVGAAKVTTTGSGDIELGSITGDLVYEGRGSSNLDAERVDGRVSITVTGSGDVEIDDGDAPTFMVSSRGSSNVEYGGTAGDVTVAASGSGSVEIDDATGEREVRSSGSSYVKIDGKRYDD